MLAGMNVVFKLFCIRPGELKLPTCIMVIQWAFLLKTMGPGIWSFIVPFHDPGPPK